MHPTQKPVAVLEKIIKIASNKNDLVLDCFNGVGSTGVAALKNNRKYIGIEIDKTYIAMVKGELTSDEIQNFKSGLYIEDYKTAPAKLRVLYYDKNKDISKLEIKIHEGKNRQVRKMCKAINHPVLRLKRVAMGKITLNDCKVGEYRHLTEAEVNYLKSI